MDEQWTPGFVMPDTEAIEKLCRNSRYARQYLESGIQPRAFSEILMEYACSLDEQELRNRLFGLEGMKGEPGHDSIRKKIDGWLKDRKVPSNREQLVRICFALHMNVEDAQNFIAIVGDGGFHYRNPVELTWLYGLKNGLDFNQTLRVKDFIYGIKCGGKGNTGELKQKFQKVQSLEEFVNFISVNAERLGKLHNTAYQYFNHFLTLLTDPHRTANGLQEDNWTVRDVVRVYLNFPITKRRSPEGVVENLRRYWPNEAMISRIINRRIDVPRKVLILLFLITDGGDYNLSVTENTKELFEDRVASMDHMLEVCGFSQLDPRNVFDRFALLTMARDEETESRVRMNSLLTEPDL